MSDLARFQDAFAAAMKGGDAAALSPFLSDPVAAERFIVYRNNYLNAVADVLTQHYVAVVRLVGDDFFRAMARAYVDANPPAEGAMSAYGRDFAGFIAGFAPARDLPYLPDVARLDRALFDALFAPEHSALAARDVEERAPDAIAALAPGLHASARIVASDWPAYAIWRTNREDETPATIALDAGGDTALIWRVGEEPRHRPLSFGEAVFLQAVGQGAPLGAAAHAAGEVEAGLDVQALFSGAVSGGVLGAPKKGEGTAW